ncbi:MULTISPECIES: HlyD family efflux transporter periplasmic adaptor subunit [unclassified Novosphingobium]|uniref:HlyD family efflux transporter periplasmic adaptor subunit n=1 Tax=unclassified Novosphingobium TaxID=2644732 RepID=UPI00135AAB07|nr:MULTISPECIES: HlyD family efflux transporter periplasmic adaptor subunit [unclassified Novosphingobium]
MAVDGISAQGLRRELDDPFRTTAHPLYRPLLWAVLACIAVAVAWAALARIDEVTRGEGRVVPVSRMQKIQSLEGGILGDLLVREGDLVRRGQPLVRLDRTHFQTSYEESANQATVLKAAIARLQSEVLGKGAITFPPEVPADSSVARSERELFASRRSKLEEGRSTLHQQMRIAQGQLAIVQPLTARKVVSEMEALKLQQDIATYNGKLVELENTYAQEAYTELANKQAELSAITPIVKQRSDQLRRTEIRSPVHGRVNTVLINTRGGVVQPGEPIMEVTPMEDRLLIEARIRPRDVAFIVPGMPAKVKITAYDYTIYGDLNGKVERIGADTIEEETVRGKEAYYQVLIRTDGANLIRDGKPLPIIPGMVAEVDILNGKRSVLNYLLRPILKARLH